jgi:hypothetical protein
VTFRSYYERRDRVPSRLRFRRIRRPIQAAPSSALHADVAPRVPVSVVLVTEQPPTSTESGGATAFTHAPFCRLQTKPSWQSEALLHFSPQIPLVQRNGVQVFTNAPVESRASVRLALQRPVVAGTHAAFWQMKPVVQSSSTAQSVRHSVPPHAYG